MEIIQSRQKTESQTKKEEESNTRDLWHNINYANLCKIGIPGGKDSKKGIKNVFEEIMAENFPSLKKETDI